MRRLFVSLTLLALLVPAVGCHHTAGVCDCDPGPAPHGPLAPVPVHQGRPAEQLQVLPKEGLPK